MSNQENIEKINNLENSLKNELTTISNLKNTTEDNKKYLMNSLEILSNNFNTNNIIEESYMLPQLFRTLNDSLSKSNSNLLILKDLEDAISSILFTISMQSSNNSLNLVDLENQLNLYNLKKVESKTSILNNSTYVQKFINSSKNLIDEFTSKVENSKESIIKKFKENRDKNLDSVEVSTDSKESVVKEDTNILYKPFKIKENDTLIISEKEAKIFLPYSLNDLFKFTENSDKDLDDVVKENFIIPINKFKNPTISRFKETYNLAKNKSNCSMLKSLNIAVDVMFKYNLNPAIIVACKNVDELTDYLNCLKEQKLDLFKTFKIKYEINPMKI